MAEPGEMAPDFTLEAARSGRTLGPSNGRMAVLVFHGPKSTDAPKVVGKAIRAAHPDAAEVVVANVVNLRAMGGMWKKVATAQVNATYDKLAAKLEAQGMDATEYVVICPDWDNAVAPLFGFDDSDRRPGVAVLAANGTVLALHAAEDVDALLASLAGAVG